MVTVVLQCFFYFLLCASLSLAVPIRVMTFNIWQSGSNVKNGMEKIAKHIELLNPDIVALQEVSDASIVGQLQNMLGTEWTGICPEKDYPDVAIMTRHHLHYHSVVETNWTMGVRISLTSGRFLSFWAAHLQYTSYGPYAAQNKMVTNIRQIMAGEKPSNLNGRYHNMMEVKNSTVMQRWIAKSENVPIIFAGDFNSPSHLDWMEDRSHEHGGWIVEWPATKILEDMGFTDSYRELYPNSRDYPGDTWSTVNKFNAEWDYTIPEPQDRIDFIFYRGTLRPHSSFTYQGHQRLNRIPYHFENDYPSDHFALITDFELY